MDDALRNGLWNALDSVIWRTAQTNGSPYGSQLKGGHVRNLCTSIWRDFFKLPIDQMPDYWVNYRTGEGIRESLRRYFFDCWWWEAYDFLEFVAREVRPEESGHSLRSACNIYLERELAGYRFVGDAIVPITEEEQLEAVESALDASTALEGVRLHLQAAAHLLSDRRAPDYRNSIKESISAVEGLCQLITGDANATLGAALKKLKDSGLELHDSYRQALQKLYGYTSDADGIRHALLEKENLRQEDAIFMLVACSGFISYLITKAGRAGLELNPTKP